jgi:hypothetical protein
LPGDPEEDAQTSTSTNSTNTAATPEKPKDTEQPPTNNSQDKGSTHGSEATSTTTTKPEKA